MTGYLKFLELSFEIFQPLKIQKIILKTSAIENSKDNSKDFNHCEFKDNSKDFNHREFKIF